MKRNIGIFDRIIRVVIALVLFYLAIKMQIPNGIRIVLSVIGGLVLVTASTGYCVLYKILHISTSMSAKNSSMENQTAKKLDISNDTQEDLFKGHK